MRIKTFGLLLVLVVLLTGPQCTYPGPKPPEGDGSSPAPSSVVVERLRKLGRHLAKLERDGNLRRYQGAAFLLQVKDRIPAGDLEIFINPADSNPPGDSRPPTGSMAFTEMYRDLDLPSGVLPRHCSWAGPNWTDFPDRPDGGRRIWACDACLSDRAPQNGVYVLWSDGAVEFLRLSSIEGANPRTRTVYVGPHSPDPRLRTVCFEELR